MSNLPSHLSFADTELTIIDHQGRPWLTAADLARALGYASPDAISRLYRRNVGEFAADMCGTVNLAVPGNPMPIPVTIFSPRGCHLVAMLSRTPRAKAFRKWVLDVLEGLDRQAAAGSVFGSLPPTPWDRDAAFVSEVQALVLQARFITYFDERGMMHMREVRPDAYIMRLTFASSAGTMRKRSRFRRI